MGCRLQPDHISLPEDDYIKPVAHPFKFGEAQQLKAIEVDPDSVKMPKAIPFDLDRLPSKPFSINDFKPLKIPVQQTKLDWDNIPDSIINMDAVPAKTFRFQKSILPKPLIVKAGLPKLVANTTSGVLQFSEEEGLPGVTVTASLEDKDGSIWLATDKGLCRYIGEYLYIYSFVNKTIQGGFYTITRMTMDNNGNIWAVTGGDGIYMFNTSTNILMHDQSKLFSSDIICDHAGIIWITTFLEGLLAIDLTKGTVKNLGNSPIQTPENGMLAIAEDHYKNIWIGHYNHIGILDADRHRLKIISKKEGLLQNVMFKFLEDSNGDMWMACYGNGLNFISLKNKTINTINSKNGFDGMGVEIQEDACKQLWILRRDTSYVLNKERTAFKQVLVGIKMQQDLKGTSTMDRNGNIWIGSIDKGVVIIDTRGPLPEHLNKQSGLVDNAVWGLLEDKKRNIWIGTQQGINIYDPVNRQMKFLGVAQGLGGNGSGKLMDDKHGNIIAATGGGFSIINPDKKIITNYGIAQHLPNDLLPSAMDSAGNLWFNTYVNGIIIYNVEKNNFKTINKKSGLTSNLSWDIITDRAGQFWIGSDSGISIVNTANNTVKYIREQEGLCNNIIYKLLQHTNGEIWAASQKGISLINTGKLTITNLTALNGLVPEAVYDLVERKGIVYAGTSDGMVVINRPVATINNNGQWNFTNYSKREGFPYSDYNQDVGIATSTGQLWWGIQPVLTVITQIPVTDTGLPHVNITGINIMDQAGSFNSYADISYKINRGDTLWNETKSKYYLKNTLPKDSGYAVNNRIHRDSTISTFNIPAGLVLPYNQNSINFSFANNNINAREKILYRSVLEGADTAWSNATGKSNSKSYFNLAPGKYTFRVCTKGINGLWSKPAELGFTISPPWWQAWWAYLLYTGLLVAVIWSYSQYRSARLKKENLVLEEKVAQRTAQLNKSLLELKATQSQLIQAEKMASLGELTAGIAHEIQNPLNFINNFSDVNTELLTELRAERLKPNAERDESLEANIINDVITNEEKINHHGKRADAIVKGMLQHSRTNTGQKEPTDINALADEYLRLSYHGLRAKDKDFDANFKTDFDEHIGKIEVVPQDIGRVLLNLFNNAFYSVNEKKKLLNGTFEPLVTITTKRTDGKVEIVVKDNGPGIPQNVLDKIFQPFFTTKPTGQGTGLGLSLSYDIIKAHGGELKVETKEGEGSEFIIQLPVR